MTRTDWILLLMECGIGVREAIAALACYSAPEKA